METYHKINALFKRYTEGKKKGKLIVGDWAVPEFGYLAKNEWEFTEKVDGTNIRIGYFWDKNLQNESSTSSFVEFGGRTDNAQVPAPLLEMLQLKFSREKFWEVFPAGDKESVSVTLYGEGYGPKIQGGGKYADEHKFVLFDVKIGNWWLDRANVNDIANKLGIDAVPVLGTGTLQDAIDIVSSGITFNERGAVVRWGRGGLQSKWGDFEAEGIVARPVVPLFNRKGQRIITKIKAVDFK